MKRFVLIGTVLIALQLMMHQTSDAQGSFSVETFSIDVTGGGMPPGDDILSSTFVPGLPPFPVIPGLGFPFDVDGFTYGRHFDFDPQRASIDFSVDGFSFGVPGSGVAFEVIAGGFGEQNYDVYRTNLATAPFTNFQIHDGNGFGPGGVAAPLGMMEPQLVGAGVPFDPGTDGYDSNSTPGRDVYWTWENRVWAPPPGTLSGADVMISAAAPGYDGAGAIFAPSLALGLDSFGLSTDNIDALEVFDFGTIGVFDPGVDLILFSLDPFSPSLGAFGATPGDVLFSFGGGSFGIAVPFGALGLGPDDNLTALSVVPEPSSALICLVAFGLAAAKRRRRI